MSRLVSRRSVHALAVGLTAAVLAVCVTLPAGAAPKTPSFPSGIESLASYVPQTTCSPTVKAGTGALRSLITSTYAGTGDYGIVRDCAIGGISEHKEGRAWDWKVNATNPSQDAAARDMFTWLLATDGHGNRYAMARRLGFMYMIYNRYIWSAYNADAGWRPYSGSNPHTDHVHISLTWPGADRVTSFWTGSATSSPSPSPSPSVATSTAAITALWSSLGSSAGTLGRATGSEYSVPGGRAQHFERGRVYWSSTTGAQGLWGAVLGRYTSLGGPDSPLGLPSRQERAVTGGVAAGFQGGQIYWSAVNGAHALWGGIGAKYLATGGPSGPLGMPTAGEAAVKAGVGARFERGRVYWSPAGTAAVWGAIAGKHAELHGPDGPLGLPTTDEVGVRGGVGTTFTGGRVYWSAPTGAHAVWGGIAGKYLQLGGPAGPLGLPTSEEGDVKGGRGSAFQGGRVYWSPTTGARAVWGAIAARYLQLGGPETVGLPTSDEEGAGSGRTMRFQAGRIYWSDATGARFLHGAVLGRYASADLSLVGFPIAEETATGKGGRAVELQRGRVVWSAATGARLVSGPVFSHWKVHGDAGGFLGLPVGELEQVTPGVQRQVFQGAHIYNSSAGPKYVMGGILGQYLTLGGPVGRLGAPTSDEANVPGGRRSTFVGGSITWNASTGKIVVS